MSVDQRDLWAYTFQGSSATDHPAKAFGSIKISPNPVQDMVLIQGEKIENAQFKMLSSDGRVLHSGQYNAAVGIVVTDLPTGVYALILENETNRYQSRFIKL
jgi:hypothetical protein